jgi:transcriptional regulator with XRE-family HTH domain
MRDARLSAGVSQRQLGAAVGVSGTHVARLERAEVAGASVQLFARLFAVLGMRLSARPYPEGPPLRDVAHARLLTRFQRRVNRPDLDGDFSEWRNMKSWQTRTAVIPGERAHGNTHPS